MRFIVIRTCYSFDANLNLNITSSATPTYI